MKVLSSPQGAANVWRDVAARHESGGMTIPEFESDVEFVRRTCEPAPWWPDYLRHAFEVAVSDARRMIATGDPRAPDARDWLAVWGRADW